MPGPAKLLFISSAQTASLAFLIYDIFITFDDEVNLIWSIPNRSWIKWQFLFIRYFAVAAQITNLILNNVINSNVDVITTTMRNWYKCQIVLRSISLLAVELVLMARVYALYKRNIWVGSSFVILITAHVAAIVIGVVISTPAGQFDDHGLFRHPNSYLTFGICVIVSQLTILSLTLVKYWTATREGWGTVPIMALVARDGIVTFLILIIVMTLTIVAASRHNGYASIGNSWLISVPACVGCRLIINMQHLSRQPQRETTVELTTIQFSLSSRFI